MVLVTLLIAGVLIGTEAAIFPMALVATFGVARAMGAGPLRIILTVLVPEARGPLILGLTFVLVAPIDVSAVADTVGGGVGAWR
ncbi:hypothetical protein AB0K43_15320 [Kitasatospora sp. NPDC049258]|uniref:hypothetical protein n=1 Tax=Kitasatospora sp. NPDC049258 TaxID=3155394 RepID=UPI0034469D72